MTVLAERPTLEDLDDARSIVDFAPNCPPWCLLNFTEHDPLDALAAHDEHPGIGHDSTIGKVWVDGQWFGLEVDASEDEQGNLRSPNVWLTDGGYSMRKVDRQGLAQLVPGVVQAYADMLANLVATASED